MLHERRFNPLDTKLSNGLNMNPNREYQKDQLENAVTEAKQSVFDQEVEASGEKQEAEELEQTLREAEVIAERQKESEEKGQETERKISEVSGA